MTDISDLVANLQDKMLEMRQQQIEYYLLMNYNPSIRQYVAMYREGASEFYFLLSGDVEIEGTTLEEAKLLYPYLEINYGNYTRSRWQFPV